MQIPIWPFAILLFCALFSATVASTMKGKTVELCLISFLAVTTFCTFAIGGILLFRAPWEETFITSERPGKDSLLALVNLAILIGPRITGLFIIGIGLYFARRLLFIIRLRNSTGNSLQ